MFILVSYDVSTVTARGRKRLRRIAKACEDYGVRVQKSVFECLVGGKDWVVLRERLLREFNEREDSLRFYFLDGVAKDRIEHHGRGKPLDVEEPLII
jgi:CRISPR-associated protein Cas2